MSPTSGPDANTTREARRILSEALLVLQRVREPDEDIDAAVEATALASSSLFELEQGTGDAYEQLRGAIRQLGKVLAALQTFVSSDPHIETALEAVARSLALLYPVARGAQRQRRDVVIDAPTSSDVFASLPPAPPHREPRDERRTEPYTGPDKRQSGERVRVEADLGLLSDSNFYTGLSQDLSTGGLFVATYQPRPPGTKVALFFVLPNGHAVRADGVVRWTSEGKGDVAPGMGIAFQRLAPGDLDAIAEFCELRSPMYHDSADD